MVYQNIINIDGEELTPIRIAGSVPVVNIVENNVFGIEPMNDVQVFFDGYFVLLKPVPPGDHLIESIGLGPNFKIVLDIWYMPGDKKYPSLLKHATQQILAGFDDRIVPLSPTRITGQFKMYT